jgi:glycosyltransferase involved in cell wall biosynthesis
MFRDRIQVLHDGIDTAYMHPSSDAKIRICPTGVPGESRVIEPVVPSPPVPNDASPQIESPVSNGAALAFRRGDKVISYVARNLEPYRGFHVFLRMLPDLQRMHPDVHVLIVGADGVSYGQQLPPGENYKRKFLDELNGKLDLSRIHFLGKVPYLVLREIFRISAAHVYLTYPFVLSWSILEAMACESLVIASRTAPVEEVITDGKDGVLVDFFDKDALLVQLDKALTRPEMFARMRAEARNTVVSRYELRQSLQKQAELLHSLARGEYPLDD